MFRKVCTTAIVAFAALAISVEALAKNVTLTVTKPTNRQDTNVTVRFDPGQDVQVPIPVGTSAEEKRDLIEDALKGAGYDVSTKDADGNDLPGNQLRIMYLHKNTTVTYDPGSTGEEKDALACASVQHGGVEFTNFFDPFDAENQPAVFTAGIITDVGELTAQVNAQELQFQTEGPIICQALFQRLAPRAQDFGADILFAGDRLEVYFDPAYSLEAGGIVFGTTSLSPGCRGTIDVPADRPIGGGSGGGLESPAMDLRQATSRIQQFDAGGDDYCVYMIVSSNVPGLNAGDTVCVDCPNGSCPATIAFVALDAQDRVIGRGRWQRLSSRCTSCPPGGQRNWRFAD